MRNVRLLLGGLALAAVMTLGVACSTGETDTPVGEDSTGLGSVGASNTGTLGDLTVAEVAALRGSMAPSMAQGGNGQHGIWVTGLGKVTLEPDQALLNLGVEVRADTVEAARAEAAVAMTGIIDALKARGIDDKDIQTSYFNISPEYTYQEVLENGRHYRKQVLTGYRVNNTVNAKIRDLDIVGVTIDEVAQAGGDATRVNNIGFIVEDTGAAQIQAREIAVLDLIAKADQFASLTGVTRGNLLFITESSAPMPVVKDFARIEAAPSADSIVTPISAGEVQVRVSVQAVFAIGSQ